MLIYHNNLENFISDTENNTIVYKMQQKMNVGSSELRSWSTTVNYMYTVLNKLNIDKNVEIGMELKIPLGNGRIDFLICGKDHNNQNKLVIIEFKQWSKVKCSSKENLVVVPKYLHEEFVHPSYQAYSYKLNLEAFNTAITDYNINVQSSSCLFQLIDDTEIKDKRYKDILEKCPVFTQGDNQKLKQFIKSHVAKGYKTQDLLYLIDTGKIKPSKMLIDTLEDSLKHNEHFVLLDKQQVAYANIMNYLNVNDDKKHVIICKGGAGTGKSVIAIKILSNLISQEKNAFYVSKNSALRTGYSKYLRGKSNAHLRTLFLGTIYISENRPVNEYDCLIVDEAHRLPERSLRGNVLLGKDLIYEIIQASKFSIFFIDDKQQVDIRDYATIERITETAYLHNAIVHNNESLELVMQFRCKGNDDYIRWIDHVLYNKKEDFKREELSFDFDIKIFDSFVNFYNAMQEKIEESPKSRIVSGDVFPWVSKSNPEEYDIIIDDIKLRWNKGTNFVVDPNQKYRVGHIDTVQGLEFDYVGLIVGEDLIYKDNKVMTDYKKHPKKAGHFRRHGRRSPLDSDFEAIDRIIRNTYNVLFTRPQKGIYLYIQDDNLREYMKEMLTLLKGNNK